MMGVGVMFLAVNVIGGNSLRHELLKRVELTESSIQLEKKRGQSLYSACA